MKTMAKTNLLTTFENQHKTNSLAHAYLVFGDVDSESLANLLSVSGPDITVLDEMPIKINHIRELIHWLYLKPHSSNYKIAILKNIEIMTLEAANAVLKALEEAPTYAVIILQAKNKKNILPTILSRCQIVREVGSKDNETTVNYLSSKEISQLSIKERFDYVNTIIDNKEELLEIINLWEREHREMLLAGKDVRPILKSISRSKHLLLTNTSVKLLIENLLLAF